MTSAAEYFKTIEARLARALRSQAEGEAAARIIFEDVAGYDRRYLFMNGEREITPYMQGKIDAVTAKVEAGEPVQYAVGRAQFMGNDYKVDGAVLIPRPETAALVDMITDDCRGRSDLRMLDIGTGSGCIAISLALALPFSRVEAVDVSPAALDVARANAAALHAAVDFSLCDILKAKAPQEPHYDVVVSNPPYVCESERDDMDSRVLDYEPATALFVPDSDPLLFYRVIAAYAVKALKPGGGLYLEINSRFPEQMRDLLQDSGFTDVDIRRDYRGAYRYAIGRLPQ